MVEVEQELLVTKTVQEVEKVKDVNFIGLYITSEEKVNSISNKQKKHKHIYSLEEQNIKKKTEKSGKIPQKRDRHFSN